MRWTTAEISYLADHALDGAENIALRLGRSVSSVRKQASMYGICLARSWICPRCGAAVRKPLDSKTGFCPACSKEIRRKRLEADLLALEDAERREKDEDRAMQRIYAKKHRMRKRAAGRRPESGCGDLKTTSQKRNTQVEGEE